jgi:hypothetical protein
MIMAQELLVHADGINLLGININIIKKTFKLYQMLVRRMVYKKMKNLITRLQVKIMINISNKTSENVAKFRYLRTTVTNQNYSHKQIKSTLNSENSC